MFKYCRALLFVSFSLCASATWAEIDKDRGVGSGIAFTAPNQALLVNPAAISEAGKINIEGLWRNDPAEPWVSIEGAFKHIGLAADYRRDPGVYYNNSGNEQIYQAGAGFKIKNVFAVGATVRSRTGRRFDMDAGASLDFETGRLAVVARSFGGGVHRIDAGIGMKIGQTIVVEADIKKSFPFNSNGHVFSSDFTAIASVHQISVGVGYYFDHDDVRGFYAGKLHAATSVELVTNFFIEAYYHPFFQEWASTEWAVGARYTF